MDFNFSGQARTRPTINLGGGGSSTSTSSTSLAAAARRERQARDALRRKDLASRTIQRVWRGRRVAAAQRALLATRLESTAAGICQDPNCDAALHETVVAALLLAQVAAAPSVEVVQQHLSHAQGALQLYLQAACTPLAGGHLAVVAPISNQSHLSTHERTAYVHTLLRISRTLLSVISGPHLFQQSTVDGAFDVLQALADSSGSSAAPSTPTHDPHIDLPQTLFKHLIVQRHAWFKSLRLHLTSFVRSNPPLFLILLFCHAIGCLGTFDVRLIVLTCSSTFMQPPVRKSAPPSITRAIDLALLPFSLFPSDSPAGRAVTRDFVFSLLNIPLLSARIPVASLTKFVMQMPYDAVATLLAQSDKDLSTEPPLSTSAILANFMAIGSKRVPHLPNGKAVTTYLTALTRLEAALAPAQTFERVRDFHQDQLPQAQDEAAAGQLPLPTDVSGLPRQFEDNFSKALLVLPSEQHIVSVLGQSNRFSASTRPALFAFLVTTLNSGWPPSVREKLISHLLYSTNLVPRSNPPRGQEKANSTATGGLIREIWRGWVRSSRLGRTLSSVPAGGGGAARPLLNTLDDPSTSSEWAPLVLLAELYSRALLTIGDDEFLSNSGGRNPLTVDEVTTLSGLLRNLAFALYWYEGVISLATPTPQGKLSQGNGSGLSSPYLPGTTVTYVRLRELVTKLIQQLHARDVRHHFMPEGGWLMVPSTELLSFVQSVVTEEKDLAEQEDEDSEGDDVAANVAMSRSGGTSAINAAEASSGGIAPMDVDSPFSSSQLHRGREVRRTAATKRMNAFLTPRLGVLNQIPFVVPFEVRVEIFRQFIQMDRDRLGIVDSRAVWLARQRARVRRGHVAEDGYDQLNIPGGQLKGPIEITFVDKFGETEMGIDGGGLFKEFLTDVIKEAFDTNRGLWLANDQQEIYPNPHSYAQEPEALAWYGFLGRILGKAIYEGILVDVRFATFFLSKWVGSGSSRPGGARGGGSIGGNAYLDDLASVASLDQELYKGLVYLKNHPEQVEDLALNFTVTDSEFGVQQTRDLVPNGSQIAVTAENRLGYIYRMSHYRLSTQIARQSQAFFSGLSEMVDPRWLRMLDPWELRVLISGTDSAVDMEDLRAHTLYSGFDPHDDTIAYLWDTVGHFSPEDKRAFIKFVTSCPAAPLLGFGQLNPRFAVSRNGDDTSRLPTASTCVNLLKLPRYTSREQLREKLLYAIHAQAGFDFS